MLESPGLPRIHMWWQEQRPRTCKYLSWQTLSGTISVQAYSLPGFLFQVKWKYKLLSRAQFFATPWTVAHQAPPSMKFSRQEYWSGLPFPSHGIFLAHGSNPGLLHCRQILYCLSHRGSFTGHIYNVVTQGQKSRKSQGGTWNAGMEKPYPYHPSSPML